MISLSDPLAEDGVPPTFLCTAVSVALSHHVDYDGSITQRQELQNSEKGQSNEQRTESKSIGLKDLGKIEIQ